ncbi:MAG: RNA-binding transcriptional accessory protein [Bacteroidales bacterium]|nr:MAG: RNA-binding transcriptional accessory protein [Bacteroidales bacterium]
MKINHIATKLNLSPHRVESVIRLLREGATIPFIARYRKEQTGSLNEVEIENIYRENELFEEIAKRKATILSKIEALEKLTPELKDRIEQCFSTTELDDIYLPYRPQRRTKAQIARERGLEPLAKIIMSQQNRTLSDVVKYYLNNDITTEEEAIDGAISIIAEWISHRSISRNSVRRLFNNQALIISKVVKGKSDTEEAQNFKDYFDYSTPLKKVRSHTLLAIRRGEAEGILRVSITIDSDVAINTLCRIFVKSNNPLSNIVAKAIEDSYKRLLKPSIELEFANQSKERADKEAISIFAENLRQLLLSPPLGQKRVLAIDPGFRTGCKVVVLDAQGNLVHNDTIYPHQPIGKSIEAMRKISNIVETYKIEAIAIGNGTAGRETESFIRKMRFHSDIQVFVVNESGASIYSASKIAREEFPNYDVTVRGSVSLGRRLMDPLAELVKIDPKSIGVGQYQHDVNQKDLREALGFVVSSCVNSVGVNVNTASKYLLTYISGIGEVLAQNIVDYRTANGAFNSRKDLMKVPKMGTKSFEQCAGFMRVENSDNPLDNSAVHPESYPIVEKMAKDMGVDIVVLMSSADIRDKIDLKRYMSSSVGMPTLTDIISELEKPSRDPRSTITVFEFDKNINKIEDIKVGMRLPGIVTNITKFGVFVDVGVHQSAMIHISNLANRFVADPNEVVKLNDCIVATVIEVDCQRKRIALSLKD